PPPAPATPPAAPTPAPPPPVETPPQASQPPSQKMSPPKPAKADAVPAVSGKDEGGEASAEDLRRSKSSPLVRKIAAEHGVDITKLEGTGLSGRVTKNDILSFIESGGGSGVQPQTVTAPTPVAGAIQTPIAVPPPPKPGVGDRVEQMSVMRKKIAE